MATCPFPFNPLVSPHLENPYPLYAQAQHEAPVFFSPLFSATLFRTPVDPPPEVCAVLAHLPPERHVLVNEDPPGHARTRTLVSKAFLPKQIARMEPRIHTIAHALIDQFIDTGHADLVRQYTVPLP